MTDTTDLLQGEGTSAERQDAPAPDASGPARAPRARRRATSGGLSAMVLPELQALAGDLGIGGTARMRKSQLIEAIQERQGATGGTAAPAGDAPAAAPAPSSGPVADGTVSSGSPAGSAGSGAAEAASGGPVTDAGGAPAPATADAGQAADPDGPTSAPGSAAATGSVSDASDASDVSDTSDVLLAAPPVARATGRRRAASRGGGAPAGQTALPGTGEPDAAPASAAPGGAGRESAASDSASRGRDAEGDGRPADAQGTADQGSAGTDRTPGADGDGAPERVDRGRERFLEREARRLERQQQQAGSGGDGDAARVDRSDRADRPERVDRSERAERPDRDRPDRSERPDRAERADRPAARTPDDDRPRRTPDDRSADPQDRDGAQRDEDDETGSRRGRFRERGRNRRNARGAERFGAESEPVVSDDDVLVPIGGILDILDNYGFVRTSGYLTGPNDVYVSLQQVRRYGLRRGDAVTGAVRQQRDGERKDRYNALVRLDSVNGLDVEEARKRPEFTKLTPLYPQDRLRLETDSNVLTTRVIDLVMPVGKGQRALIVSPPKAGKTMVMQSIANAIATNNPECHLMVVLVDERPEEVTDMQRSVKGEVIASTFDRPPQDHITVAELSIERAKRLVELGHDVVVLLDSITRLGRAYNLGAPASGRILTGGVDSAALYPPKRFLGAARNVENGGSLTIFATALVETGSAMDTVIFEEFKGTGNAELKLDRRLADKRIFPAIDVDASGTRKEEILLAPEELRIVLQLRRVLHALDTTQSLELLLDKIKGTRTNVEFLMQISKTTGSQDEK